jgi:hypothetical protein
LSKTRDNKIEFTANNIEYKFSSGKKRIIWFHF